MAQIQTRSDPKAALDHHDFSIYRLLPLFPWTAFTAVIQSLFAAMMTAAPGPGSSHIQFQFLPEKASFSPKSPQNAVATAFSPGIPTLAAEVSPFFPVKRSLISQRI